MLVSIVWVIDGGMCVIRVFSVGYSVVSRISVVVMRKVLIVVGYLFLMVLVVMSRVVLGVDYVMVIGM